MIKVDIPSKIVLPNYKFDQKALREMAEVAEASIIDNVLKQKQADGRPLKRNPAGYAAQKAARGHGSRALVAKLRRFLKGSQQTWKHIINRRKSTVEIVPATSEIATIVDSLHDKGYEGWVGINASAAKAIEEVLVRFVRRAGRKAK